VILRMFTWVCNSAVAFIVGGLLYLIALVVRDIHKERTRPKWASGRGEWHRRFDGPWERKE